MLFGGFVPTKVIRVDNKDRPWFDDQCRGGLTNRWRLIFGGEGVISLGLTWNCFPTVN